MALQLAQRGARVAVFDEPGRNVCTTVAAGLCNPITGKGLAKTWLADQLFPYLHDFYTRAEAVTQQRFFYPASVYRPFLTVEEQNEWMAHSSEPHMAPYVQAVFTQPAFAGQVHDPLGGLLIDRAAYVHTGVFRDAVQSWLRQYHVYRPEMWEDEALTVTDQGVTAKGLSARAIIFCQGAGSLSSRWFSWVPIQPLKGETLTVRFASAPQAIFNRGVYAVPRAQPGLHTVGATYNWRAPSPGITPAARAELDESLRALTPLLFEITEQQWGVRPTVPDRRPVLGPHPHEKRVYLFNGLGTKGVSLSPYFAGQLADTLMGRSECHPSVNISRFYPLYSKSQKQA
ncbi:MAG: FAD-binding oxidoreductase [Cyclobacteriaceae bacterium]|nr:FAD-binding oxidoreductase [Cyclobacteriaceae bacterium]